jgi:hypothetical protein
MRNSNHGRLSRLFRPDLVVSGFLEVGPERLRGLGRNVLLLDVDGTLAPHGSDTPPEGVAAWIGRLADEGIRCFVVSNAGHDRMARFCAPLGVSFLARAGKPSPSSVLLALKKLGASPEKAAFLGDQLFTDMACAKRAGVLAVLSRPIPGREPVQIVLKRAMERILVRRILDPKDLLLWKTGVETRKAGD